MLAVYFDELAKRRVKEANASSSGPRGLVAGPGEVVVTEEEVDEDE